MTYQDLVAHHFQTLTAGGWTQQQIAYRIGLKSGNVVCMHIKKSISPLPLKRLPALARICGLDAYESIRLVHARAKHCPTNATEMDEATLKWILQCATTAAQAVKAKRVGGVAHG